MESSHIVGLVDDNMKVQGLGRAIYESGNFYEGQFLDDKRDGYGIFIWNDGANYLGMWKNGMKHGPGYFTFADG